MKIFTVLIISLLFFLPSFASHIAGGELFYEYQGNGSSANTSRYKVTMRLFRDCNSSGQKLETESVVIGIYHTGSLSLFSRSTLVLQPNIETIQLNTGVIPCLVNAPRVCFQIGLFTGFVDLPSTGDGFTLSWIRCCRIDAIANLETTTGIGATFTTTIPGTAVLPGGNNSSPQFAIKDTALVCQNKGFSLDFGANDPDGDSLSYSFCDAYLGGNTTHPNPGSEPAGPPQNLKLISLPYGPPFSGLNPLGANVTIDSHTGKITGTAPVAGRYVINVCVNEWRNGVVINVHRKDFILQVGNCDYTAADPIPAAGAFCKDLKVNFSNNSTSSTIQSYYWDFGVTNSDADVSTDPEPVFTYPDTGLYTIKLIVKGSAGCVDTGTTVLGVYPGFKPDFDFTGSCYQSPFNFKDRSSTNYGSITNWKWSFGDAQSSGNVSTLQNPAYKFADTGLRNVQLVVKSSKGCIDSITKPVAVTDKPFLSLPFKDTLICSIDTLLLKAIGSGTFTWKPAYNIVNPNSANPFVYPKDTTTYIVTLVQNSCVTSDSIRVNVLDSISVYAGADTTICRTDTVTLKPVSYGLQYQWTPVSEIAGDPNIKNALATPDGITTYYITANLGKCQAKDAITIAVVPYPKANAGPDATVCYGKQAALLGSITGASFTWTPSGSLINPTTLTPVAQPLKTTLYVLTVNDTIGCPKPGTDTVAITVVPPVNAFAGNDTSIVANQPLQLNASGGTDYAWSPSTGMNNAFVSNPLVVLGPSYDSVTYTVKVSVEGGCFAEDEVKVKVFKTSPDIFVPNAFTPNSDGRNDVLKPIPVGIKSMNYFRIFNRWGQMLYSTSIIGTGWDGTFGGQEQGTGTYVFIAQGTDYLGRLIQKKGTVILIR